VLYEILFLISSSAHDFLELQSLKDRKSSEGTRDILDVSAFCAHKPIPGFISNIYNKCIHTHSDENVVFHEFIHAIHYYGTTQEQNNMLKILYNKYNVNSDNYDIKSYAFVDVYEFFATMSQVYCQMSYNLKASGNVTYIILKNNLPELYTFLESIFNIDPNNALIALCTNCNQDLLCKRQI
jgi:hypothetical protein